MIHKQASSTFPIGMRPDFPDFPATIFPVMAFLAAFLSLAGISPSYSQSFRGEVQALERISSAEPLEILLEGGAVLLLLGQEEFPYLQGLRIIADPLPRGMPPGGFSLLVFGDVDPPHEELLQDAPGHLSLAGRSLARIPLNPERRESLTIELAPPRPFPGEAAPGLSAATATSSFSRGAIALQILPATKGFLPRHDEHAHRLRIEPIVAPFGGILVEMEGDASLMEKASPLLSLSLDGENLQPETATFLSPGIYQLQAQAGEYLQHRQNIGIEEAVTTRITLQPHEPRSFLTFQVPSVAEVFLDGEPLSADSEKPLEHPPGLYLLFIGLGDFFISRSILLEPHGEYEIGLDLDVLIRKR
ncbi:hypothetical protein SAMN05920897_10546 [Alkalispirochaeta americana]|uniref:PEGA domain-containing protein n=1 Tax=Alkalispirochaeta americana TaxID=159291 RepID=A0A1N6QTQ8_9SPIO|nr:hypothetical protein [Alkalispirochaeta americana]SIQ20009.1 hypothetical protein SAMN05920897_10546 [Alkalispirochaeta americana]